MRCFVLALVFALCVAAGSPASANPAAAAGGSIDIRFTPAEVRIIHDFYADAARPGGKGRKSGLPPGIEKNLGRGKPLPPGIAKQALPGDLLRRLPPAPDGYERIIVAGKILLVEIATQVVRDVLTDALFD